LEPLCDKSKDYYKGDFQVIDKAIAHGRVATSTREREKFWEDWCGYVKPVGVSPSLTTTDFATTIRAVTGFG